MRGARAALGAVLLGLLVLATHVWGAHAADMPPVPGPPHPATGQAPATTLAVELDTGSLTSQLGRRFSFTSRVRNDGDGPSSPAIAHLTVLSLDPDVYVDPEDWSADRTRYLGPLPARSTTPVTWTVQAVNAGRLLLYVTLTEPDATDAAAVSPVRRLEVTPRPRLTGQGALPLAVGVPGALLVLTGLAAWMRRTRSRPRSAAESG